MQEKAAWFALASGIAVLALACGGSRELAPGGSPPPAGPGGPNPDSETRAIEIARATIERMGGWRAWEETRYLSWSFFGRREHYWDRHTGRVRIEGPVGDERRLWLMNVETLAGRAWRNGEEITDPEALREALQLGRQVWVNDSYWLIMPFKLLDPGVTLKYGGERALPDGRAADVLDLRFSPGVGYTPENRYEVYVARDTGLVEQWSFYRQASETEPVFTLPWAGWRPFGRIWIATDHGRGAEWNVRVYETLPEAPFEDPSWKPEEAPGAAPA